MPDRSKRLRRLVDLRALSERDAALALAAASAEVAKVERALDVIERFAADYAGVPVAAHSGLRLRQQAEMHARLRAAADQQRRLLIAAERRVSEAQAHYHAALRGRRSIAAVVERRARDEALAEARREQRRSDDWAAARAWTSGDAPVADGSDR